MPYDEKKLVHVLFRGVDAGMEIPTARSTPFALQEGTLTPEKIDNYCDSLAQDIILREGRASPENTMANHVIMFAAEQVYNQDVNPKIEGVR